MDPYLTRAKRKLRGDRGEVASWLILAAALAVAAALAASTLGSVIASLASNVAEAAQVGSGTDAPAGPADTPTGPADGGPGAGSPTGPDAPTGPADGGPGAGSPTGPDAPTGPADGGPGAGSPTGADEEPDPLPDSCSEFLTSSCDAEGNCRSFDPLGCSSSHTARDLYNRSYYYEECSVGVPSIILCGNHYTRGFEPGFKTILESELGAHPGDLYLLAARICDSGNPSCEFWGRFARFVHDNRAALAATALLGDLLPGPSGVGCLASVVDGSVTGGEAAECGIGLATGLGIPIPSGVIDDALDG